MFSGTPGMVGVVITGPIGVSRFGVMKVRSSRDCGACRRLCSMRSAAADSIREGRLLGAAGAAATLDTATPCGLSSLS